MRKPDCIDNSTGCVSDQAFEDGFIFRRRCGNGGDDGTNPAHGWSIQRKTLSLAAMEKFVHMGDEGRSVKLVSYRISIPADVRVEILKRSELPKDWKSFPAPQSTMAIESNWVKKANSAVIKVPSVVIEKE